MLPVPAEGERAVSTAQVSFVRRLLERCVPTWMNVDPPPDPATVLAVNLRHFRTKLSRLNLTKADREVAALKEQFRKEDLALASEGKHEEIALRNRRLMGLKDGERTRLVGFGGVRFE